MAMDLVFVVDASESTTRQQWDLTMQAMTKLLESVGLVVPQRWGVHVAIVTMSQPSKVPAYL